MKKEILFVNNCLTGGGSEKAMSLLANYFVSQEFKVSMMLLDEAPRTYKLDPRIRVVECYCPMLSNKLLWHFKRIKTIRNVLKNEEAKTVISFMWDINMRVIMAAIGLGKNIIASERCDPRHEPRKLILFAMNVVLPFAKYSVFQTPEVQSYYPKSVQKKSCVIPNAISDMLPQVDRNDIRKEIVAVGRMTEQKNFELLIKSFSDFVKKFPDYKLVIYGEGVLRKKLEALVAEKSLTDKVLMPGYVSDVNFRMQNAAMYVNSSDYEGISNAMLEAMALGLPCICTDCPVGGAAMFINNKQNGILIPTNDESALTRAMIEIAESEELASCISNAAFKIRERLDIKVIGRRWLDICEKVEEKL